MQYLIVFEIFSIFFLLLLGGTCYYGGHIVQRVVHVFCVSIAPFSLRKSEEKKEEKKKASFIVWLTKKKKTKVEEN